MYKSRFRIEREQVERRDKWLLVLVGLMLLVTTLK